MADDMLPTPEEILATHEELEDAYNMQYTGTRVPAPKLDLRDILQECEQYERPYFRAACLLRQLITMHLFEDGNKRTAWVTTREYLSRLDEVPAERGPTSERVLKRIRRYDVGEIAEWLEKGEIDKDRLQP
ncbi:hypothetical protein BV210_11530 [Halorientalis sp. IM1011]|uniref:Fic family protein n=1 Tax=Halorientalis sp. IM1011 TaxID=1932360 RepID=UPI00097CCDB1|nr:Fic family protein [Halorientalis sp. IM1011]AQL43285.1 hypothetical protein BV210_11530 [Halorientalis sp. IM1011]